MSNPVFADRTWSPERESDRSMATTMTAGGAVGKALFMATVLFATMGVMWHLHWQEGAIDVEALLPLMTGGIIGGLVLALVVCLRRRAGPLSTTIYAVCQGLFLGALTMIVEVHYPGLPLLAATYTGATLVGMLLLYKAGVIRVGPRFMRGVIGATAGLALGVVALWLLSMFGVGTGLRAMLYGNGAIGIGFSLLCIGLAALNLVLDFHVIEQGERQGLPKRFEWMAAFGLMVTLVWLYVEILRLLIKLNDRS